MQSSCKVPSWTTYVHRKYAKQSLSPSWSQPTWKHSRVSNFPTQARTTVVSRDCWHQSSWLHALFRGYSSADQTVHNHRRHIAKSYEHNYDRLATYHIGSSYWYPRVLELQRRVNSSRCSLIQRNESDCSCFYETSFWPGMANQIKDRVQKCEVCNDFLDRQQKEPLMTHKVPETPWSRSLHPSQWELFGDCWLLQRLFRARSRIRHHDRIGDKCNQMPLRTSWHRRHGYRQWSAVF